MARHSRRRRLESLDARLSEVFEWRERGRLKAYADLGFTPPAFWFWASGSIETFAGIALILGLFTRFFAAAAAIEMLIITIIHWGNGFGWMRRGYEYVLLWGLVCFAIALRGGGPYSVDRKIGREL